MADAQTCLVSKAYEQMMVSDFWMVTVSRCSFFRVVYGFMHRGQMVVRRIVLHILGWMW